MNKTYITLALGMSAITLTSHSESIAYDGFDGNATGFSSAFSTLASNSLSYNDGTSDLATLVGASNTGGSRYGQTATLTSAITSVTHDIVWFSALVDVAPGNTGNDDFRLEFTNGSSNGFAIQSQFGPSGNPTADVNISVMNAGTMNQGHFDSGATATEANFFVVSLDMDTGALNAWANPNISGGLGAADVTLTNTIASSTGIDRIQLQWAANNDFLFDEIRIGTSFADVAPVPEASRYAFLLGGVALVCVLLRRRS